jgi:gas vesicle structural protein
MSDEPAEIPGEHELEDRQLALGDLLNHVLDKGVVISGNVIISIAGIDLLAVDLKLVLASVQTMMDRYTGEADADVPLLRSDAADR